MRKISYAARKRMSAIPTGLAERHHSYSTGREGKIEAFPKAIQLHKRHMSGGAKQYKHIARDYSNFSRKPWHNELGATDEKSFLASSFPPGSIQRRQSMHRKHRSIHHR